MTDMQNNYRDTNDYKETSNDYKETKLLQSNV